MKWKFISLFFLKGWRWIWAHVASVEVAQPSMLLKRRRGWDLVLFATTTRKTRTAAYSESPARGQRMEDQNEVLPLVSTQRSVYLSVCRYGCHEFSIWRKRHSRWHSLALKLSTQEMEHPQDCLSWEQATKNAVAYWVAMDASMLTSTLHQRKGRAPPPIHHMIPSCDNVMLAQVGVSPVGGGGGPSMTTRRAWLHKAVPTSSRLAQK